MTRKAPEEACFPKEQEVWYTMEEKKKKVNPLYRVVRFLVWLFAPKFTLVGEENLPDGPCVIVGNHSQMYGPIVGELYIPGKHAVWCTGEMMEWKEVHGYAYQDFWSGKPKAVRWFFYLLSYLITPLSVLIFRNADTIPVYRDARVLGTFRDTVEALEKGTRVVIFPECYDEYNNIVHSFQDRFIDLAKLYKKKTGQMLPFVPMYTAPRLKKVFFGKPVLYDHGVPAKEERVRVARALMDAVTEIAAAQELHTVVPYPNIPKKQYPKNLPVVRL